MAIPPTILDHHPTVNISGDFMFVQGMPFLHTISSCYKFRTIQAHTKGEGITRSKIKKGILKVIKKYEDRGLNVAQLNCDNQFECIREDVAPINLNVVGAGEHVGDIERSIRTIKEGIRCHIHRLPYRRYPRIMVRGAVIKTVQEANDLPVEDGVADNISPGTLIVGTQRPNYNNIIQLNFGDYVQVHEGKTITNTNEGKTVGTIALYPSGNGQNGWHFMSLSTGRKLHKYQWDVLPMPQDAIYRVEEIAAEQGEPVVESNFLFEKNIGELYFNDEDEDTEDDIEVINDVVEQGNNEQNNINDDNNDMEEETNSDVEEAIIEDEEINNDEPNSDDAEQEEEDGEIMNNEDITDNDN